MGALGTLAQNKFQKKVLFQRRMAKHGTKTFGQQATYHHLQLSARLQTFCNEESTRAS
jgi:hypothetical protein